MIYFYYSINMQCHGNKESVDRKRLNNQSKSAWGGQMVWL